MAAIAPKPEPKKETGIDLIFGSSNNTNNGFNINPQQSNSSKASIMNKFNATQQASQPASNTYMTQLPNSGGMHGAFNPNFNQMNQPQAQNNGAFNATQSNPAQTNNNNGWVGFGSNAQQQQQNGGNNDFMSGNNQPKDSKSSILGKYHAQPSNEFMTALPGR